MMSTLKLCDQTVSNQFRVCIGIFSHVSAKEDSKGNTKLGKKDVVKICIDKGPAIIMLVLN
jgi:hypothetical protein